MHQHKDSCGCGEHHHEHGKNCGCKDHHEENCECGEHHHGEGCGCGEHPHDEGCGCGDHHEESCGCGEHHHGEGCGCGEHHEESCGCGEHHHGEGCGCGHHHHEIPVPEGLSPVQCDVLMALAQRSCLPVACFGLAHSQDAGRHATMLEPVYLNSPEDALEQVKWLAEELSSLEKMGLITLDYDIPIQGYGYEEYKEAQVYQYFVETVREGAQRPGSIFDTPVLYLGSMALTAEGAGFVDQMLAQA